MVNVLVSGGRRICRCISENINKARKAFFGYGSIGAFLGLKLTDGDGGLL